MKTISAENLYVHIDNRLVHGQVAVNWKQALQFDTIVVPDDVLMHDQLNKTLMKMTVQAAGLKGYFVTVAKAAQLIKTLREPKESLISGKWTRPALFVICRTPETVRRLIEGGVSIEEVTIWNMFSQDGKRRIAGTVYMDDQDLADVSAIKACGTKVALQATAYSRKKYL